MPFKGRTTDVALAGTAQAFILPYNRDKNNDEGKYVHNDVPTENVGQVQTVDNGELSQVTKALSTVDNFVNELHESHSSLANSAAPVAKQAALPGTQKPIGDQQYPLWANGELPRPRNGLSAKLDPYKIHPSTAYPRRPDLPPVNHEEYEKILASIGAKRVYPPSPLMDNTSIAATNNTGHSSPPLTREEAANVLLDITNARVFTPPPPSVDNISRATINNTYSDSSSNSNTASSSPSSSQRTVSPVSLPNDNVQAKYFRLGLRRGVYERCVTPPGYFPVEQSRIRAPTRVNKKPTWNYLMYKYLSVLPGHRMATTSLILAIMEWVPEIVAPGVGFTGTKRNAQAAKCRNRVVFMMEDRIYTRLRRVGEPEQNPTQKKDGKKRDRDDDDDDEEGPDDDEPQPIKKKQQTKKPAAKRPKKGGNGKGKKATSSNLFDFVTEDLEDN